MSKLAREIRSLNDLNKLLLNECKKVTELLANEVYEAINFFLNQYYEEYNPIRYQRSYDFLHSAFKTNVKKIGNGYEAVVGIDYESLNDYDNATGYQVVSWANEGLHGGLDFGTDTRVWDDAMDVTIHNGQLLKDCIEFLKNKGFKVIV